MNYRITEQWKAETTRGTTVEPDLLSVVCPRVSMTIENRTCKEVIDELCRRYDLSVDLLSPEPAAEEQGTGECEICGGPCCWEYTHWYEVNDL